MIDHIWLRVKDIHISRNFYEKLLKPLWYRIVRDKLDEWLVWFAQCDEEGKRNFWIKEYKELPETSSISCFAFKAGSKEQVNKFYYAGIDAGWTDNGMPGFRWKYHNWYYAAFVIDPDGHNIEAVFDEI